jgi:acetylglutamate kinase
MTDIVVVKVGGEIVAATDTLQALCKQLQKLSTRHRIVVVHGGGPQVNALQARLQLSPKKIAGQRVTTPADLFAVVAGLTEVNVQLCAALVRASVRCVGTHGATVFRARRRAPVVVDGVRVDYGEVGDVIATHIDAVSAMLAVGVVVVATLALDDITSDVLNVNGDDAASRCAIDIGAAALLLATTVGGVYQNINDESSRISVLSRANAEDLIACGVIAGGMIPKVREALDVVDAGVGRVVICDPREGDWSVLGNPSIPFLGTTLTTV